MFGWAKKADLRGKRLLIIDDDPDGLMEFEKTMRGYGFDVTTLLADPYNYFRDFKGNGRFHDAEEFARLVKSMNIDAMLTDGQMIDSPPFHGAEAIALFKTLKPHAPCALHTKAFQIAEEEFGADAAERAYRGQNTEIKELGGLGAFWKYDDDVIADAFAKGLAAKRAK